MYHAIVERIATANLARVNDHDYDAFLATCALIDIAAHGHDEALATPITH